MEGVGLGKGGGVACPNSQKLLINYNIGHDFSFFCRSLLVLITLSLPSKILFLNLPKEDLAKFGKRKKKRSS